MRVRLFELRLIAMALVLSWTVAAVLVLVAYRPGGPLDIGVGATFVLPILIAAVAVPWPPLARGAGAFPLMVCLGLGSLLVLMPSIGGVIDQLLALGSQTLLPSPEAAYPWLLALLGTGLFSGFGIARRALGAAALRPRRLIAGMAIGLALSGTTAIAYGSVAVTNEFALRDRPGVASSSRFGPTALGDGPPACDGDLGAGRTARLLARLSGTIDLRPSGSVEQAGTRDGDEFRWLAYVATDRELGWYGAATTGGLAWLRSAGRGWQQTSPSAVADATIDVRVIDAALTADYRAVAEDRGTEVIEGAPARRCRIAVDGATFRSAFPQVRWLVGQADIGHWRGQLDFWVFMDGQVGQVAGDVSGEGSVVEPDALRGTVEVLLTATERGRPVVIYPPGR